MHHLGHLLVLLLHAVHVEKDGDSLRVRVGPASSPLHVRVSLDELGRQVTQAVPAPARPFVPLALHEVADAVARHQRAERIVKEGD